MLFDENFRNEIYRLYPWQIEILKQFSADIPAEDMIRMAIVAANGSGKSQYVLAPCAVWMAVAFHNSLSYVTSSSASQLDTQTERFIDSLADKMNKFCMRELGFKDDVWKIIKRQKVFLPNTSMIDLFATDEPRKAEGKHPLYPGGEFAIFVDEGKSIEENIYGAIDRCTGATRRLDISSAGGCHGHFYDINTKPELGWWTRKIIWSDCPHVRNTEFKQAVAKHGINDPLVRSIFFSEFTSIDDSTVITRETWDKCAKYWDDQRIVVFGEDRMGVDLSAGGDEYVCSIWRGNVQLGLETFRFYDTDQGAKEVISIQQKYGIRDENVWIEFDGFNRGVVDNISGKGHSYNTVLSGGKAKDSKRYANRATELWFLFKRYVEEGYVKFFPDQQLKDQFCGRYYKRSLQTSKIQLESKKEARAKGHCSPDRADATVFAWAACPDIDEFITNHITAEKDQEIKSKVGLVIKSEEMEQQVDKWTYGEESFFSRGPGSRAKRRSGNSLSVIEKMIRTNKGSGYGEN